jgi:hypothetical protein
MPGPLNTDFFDSLTAQINECTDCAQLQAVATQSITQLNLQLVQITTSNATFEALQVLLTGPAANPDAIVTWINTLITSYLGPQLAAYAKLTAQLAALTVQIATLTGAITSKASSFESCSITIPT